MPVDLSEASRALLTKAIGSLDVALGFIDKTVTTHDLPHKYDELAGLMRRQKIAIINLLEGREMGCELAELEFDYRIMLTNQHLINLSFIAGKTSLFEDEAKKEAMLIMLGDALHDIKNKSATAELVHHHLTRVITTCVTVNQGNENV